MSKIIIGALTNWAYECRRKMCLDSWVAQACHSGISALFLFASEKITAPEQLGPHALVCPTNRDGKDYLSPITHGFCRWAVGSSDWDYLFKCDDDSFIHIPRLLAYDTADRDYIGAEWKPGVDYGSGGAGYFLSRRSAEIIARQPQPGRGAEDVWVGNVMRRAGIKLSIEPRLIAFAKINRRPMLSNDLITSHACTAAFHACVAEFSEIG